MQYVPPSELVDGDEGEDTRVSPACAGTRVAAALKAECCPDGVSAKTSYLLLSKFRVSVSHRDLSAKQQPELFQFVQPQEGVMASASGYFLQESLLLRSTIRGWSLTLCFRLWSHTNYVSLY